MRLRVGQPRPPILSVPDIDLQDFTLITGLNGSGKSQLLNAIQDGRVRITPEISLEQIVYFTWLNFASEDGGQYNSGSVAEELHQIKQNIEMSRNGFVNALNQLIHVYPVLAHFTNRASEISSLTEEQLLSLGLSDVEARHVVSGIAQTIAAYDSAKWEAGRKKFGDPFATNLTVQGMLPPIYRIASKIGKQAIDVTGDDITIEDIEEFQGQQLLQQRIGQVFIRFMEADKVWRLKKLAAIEAGEQFDAPRAMPPWELLNDTMARAGIDFEINQPDPINSSVYTPVFTKRGSSDKVFHSQMSSGEKIFVSLALCVYQTLLFKDVLQFPKLILLDEIDAVLHPSMIKYYLIVIIETFVKDLGIKVIATTHSPTTVALAPDNSIYVMNDGSNNSVSRIQKTTKAEALNILTVGVPTLAISFDNRRQVFVEDGSDAELYQILFEGLKSRLNSERGLTFIGTGLKRTHEQENVPPVNTGCEVVKQTVERLVQNGNMTVWGLVDWDGKNEPAKRLKVFAKGKRHSIENAILDPRAIIALFHLEERCRADLLSLGLKQDSPLASFTTLPDEEIQSAISKLCDELGFQNKEDDIEILYLDKKCFKVRKEYLLCRGHALEKRLLDRFQALKFTQSLGGLKKVIATRNLREFPLIIQSEIEDCFREILEDQSH